MIQAIAPYPTRANGAVRRAPTGAVMYTLTTGFGQIPPGNRALLLWVVIAIVVLLVK